MAQRWPHWSDEAWQAHCEGFGLEPHLLKPLWHLSTGTLRKLGMAAALASGARVTVIEEPIAALDTASIRYLSQALDALGEALASTPEAPRWMHRGALGALGGGDVGRGAGTPCAGLGRGQPLRCAANCSLVRRLAFGRLAVRR